MNARPTTTIRRKVAVVILLVTVLGIVLAALGVFILQRATYAKLAESQLNTIADVVGGSVNEAFLSVLPSPADAERVLARLRDNSEIDEAHTFELGTAERFASAPAAAVPSAEIVDQVQKFARQPPLAPDDGPGRAEVSHVIFRSGAGLWLIRELVDERGTPFALVALHSTFDTLRADERRSLLLLGGVTLVMLGVALWAARQLNRSLITPILALAGTVRQIEASGDRTLRASRDTTDEVGQLAEDVNHMLDAIEERSAALRESEERSRMLLATVPAGIVVFDLDTGKFIEANANACQLFGLTREEMLRHGPVELSRPIQTNGRDARRYAQELLERTVSGQQPRFEWIHLHTSGREIPCEISLVRLPAAQRRLICGSILDMTERKRGEEALRHSRSSLEQAQALAHLGSWEINLPTGAVEWSREQARLLDWPADRPAPDWAGWVALVHPEDQPAVERFREHVLAGNADATVEFRTRPDAGPVRTLSLKAALTRDAEGRAIRMAGTTLDVTEQRRLEAERRELEAQLRQAQKLDALGTLAGGIAHDFNNILSAIIGNVELGRADLADRECARECFEEIHKAACRARDLVQRILAFSRRQEQTLQCLALQPVIEEALELLRSTLPAQVELRFQALPGVPAVMADPSQIHQVVLNLATNAWHALEERPGRISLELAPVQVDTRLSQSVPDLHPGRYVRFEISDTGCGMTPVTLERIFEPFYTTKPPGKGTGLGLSMVHGILKSHGGAIVVESRPGRGSTFRLLFPAVEAAPVAPTVAVPDPVIHGAGRHILYIDDEEPLVYLATRMLERLGFRVTGHTAAVVALADFRRNPEAFDAVVTDLSMPGISGLEVARELLAVRPDLPVLLASGYLKEEDVAAARAAGVREVVLKPSTVEQLGQIIHKLMSGVANDTAAG